MIISIYHYTKRFYRLCKLPFYSLKFLNELNYVRGIIAAKDGKLTDTERNCLSAVNKVLTPYYDTPFEYEILQSLLKKD